MNTNVPQCILTLKSQREAEKAERRAMKQAENEQKEAEKEARKMERIRVKEEKQRIQEERQVAREQRKREREEEAKRKSERQEQRRRNRVAKEQKKLRFLAKKEKVKDERMKCVSKARAIFDACNPEVFHMLNVSKYMRHCLTGMSFEGEPFSITEFTNRYIELFGKEKNAWTGEEFEYDTKYDFDASIRSLLFEMSPSSCQNYFKFGKLHKYGLDCPFPFVNQTLFDKNASFEWKKCEPGSGRATRGRHWKFVEDIYTKPITAYAPNPEVLEAACEGRKVGTRS